MKFEKKHSWFERHDAMFYRIEETVELVADGTVDFRICKFSAKDESDYRLDYEVTRKGEVLETDPDRSYYIVDFSPPLKFPGDNNDYEAIKVDIQDQCIIYMQTRTSVLRHHEFSATLTCPLKTTAIDRLETLILVFNDLAPRVFSFAVPEMTAAFFAADTVYIEELATKLYIEQGIAKEETRQQFETADTHRPFGEHQFATLASKDIEVSLDVKESASDARLAVHYALGIIKITLRTESENWFTFEEHIETALAKQILQ